MLLSGDRHMSSVSSLGIDDGAAAPIGVVSIVSSGLYTPWPFANSRPDKFMLDGPVTLSSNGRNLTGEARTCATGTSDGYAVVSVECDASGAWTIHVQLDLADEVHDRRRALGDGSSRDCKTSSTRRMSPST